ncbi:MAG: Nramp family divalent metal transporter [Nitrospiria bacterium]
MSSPDPAAEKRARFVLARIPALKPAAMPTFPGWRTALGPGIVWMALAQGSGELIWWPYLVAKYGLGFLFLLIPACFLQYPLNFQIGHYTAMTGESIWQGFVRLNRTFAIILWVLMGISFLWFGAFAAAGGTALSAMTDFPGGLSPRSQSLFWGYLSIAVFFVALRFSQGIYRLIERIMFAVAAVTLIGLLAACAHPGVRQHIPAFSEALLWPQWPADRPWQAEDATKLLTAVTFAGLGGFWTLFYSYWLREKGVGMSARYLAEPGQLEGWTIPGGTRPGQPLKQWRRFLWVDSGIGVVGNLFTTLMTCLLAYALLFPEGTLPEKYQLAVVQARFFEVQWGVFGRMLFLFVAAAFLADTWLTTIDAVCRINTDMLLQLFPASRGKDRKYWYRKFLYLFTAITLVTMLLDAPGRLIQFSAVVGFAGTVVFSGAVLILNHRRLPLLGHPENAPGRAAGVGLGMACCVYFALAVGYIGVQLDLW